VQQSESESPSLWWPAPPCTHPVHATVDVPGSKSASNRALVLSALSNGPSTITGLLDARDTQLMITGLRALGVDIDTSEPDSSGNVTARITPTALKGPADIHVGLAGTVMRFLPPVAALATGRISFDGDPHARVRPMQSMIDALTNLGVTVTDTSGHLPFSLNGVGHVRGGTISIDASASSQFISGLLLSAARFENGLTIDHVGPPVPSLPHIDMTIAMLREHGVLIDTDRSTTWTVQPGDIHARDTVIEPDFSNAAPFLAAALITRGTVTVTRWPNSSTQPGIAIRELLERMGAQVTLENSGLTVTGTGHIRGIDADLSAVGELAPTIAALAALATEPSRLTGIAHLRGHETDRLAALTHELNELGGDVVELSDGLLINPVSLHAGRFHTYADHRMATAGALIGLHVPGVEVENIATTNKTIPDFPRRWSELLVDPS
jgi:3-phosphoshikimate 1-carboxyvinyltransferase